ncbi:hypothetical protein ACFRU3_40480 [Streptomyces sp. NPDC056910]|uniref:hypothetical protein n=1 Tax=Streptomyces sp. NPDC056910 TaxID=3345964 RepID=UPI0036CF1837
MVAAWNPLSMEGRAEEEIQDVIGSVVAGLAAAQGWGDGAPRARAILSHAVEILAHLAYLMCQRWRPDVQPTLFTIPRLLTDAEWRESVLAHMPLKLQQFWRTTFPKYEGSAVPVVTQTIEQLATSTSLRAFLGQPQSTYDVRKAMDERQIVLLRCSGTGDQIITSLLLFDLFRAGHSREDADPELLATLFAFADELKAIDGAARGYIAAILEQLRKYEVRQMAMTQMAMRVSEASLPTSHATTKQRRATSLEDPVRASWLNWPSLSCGSLTGGRDSVWTARVPDRHHGDQPGPQQGGIEVPTPDEDSPANLDSEAVPAPPSVETPWACHGSITGVRQTDTSQWIPDRSGRRPPSGPPPSPSGPAITPPVAGPLHVPAHHPSECSRNHATIRCNGNDTASELPFAPRLSRP